MYDNKPMILPEELSEVSDTTDADVTTKSAADFRALDGKNVFVEFKDGRTLIGKMKCFGTRFEVGQDNYAIHLYTNIHFIREV